MKTVIKIFLNSEELDHIRQQVPSNKEFETVIKNHQTYCISMHQKAFIPDEVSTNTNFPTTF